MSGSLRQQTLPSMLFLIVGLAFAVRRWFALPPTPIISVVVQSHYVELGWLGVGVVVCLLYAILYYMAARFLNLSISLGLSLVHLLCIAVFPDGRFHLEQRSGWTESKPQIYEDSVPDYDLKSLLTIIADPELRDLQGIDTGGVVFRQSEHGEIVWALVSRGETTQKLLFNSQTGSPEQSSKALPRPLGDLVGWSDATAKNLNRRKIHPLKNAKPVMCWMAN